MICEGRGQLVGDRVVKRKNLVLDERCVKNVNSGMRARGHFVATKDS